MSPDASRGPARIAVILSSNTLATHVAGSTGVVPGPALPPGLVATGVAFAAPDRVVVAGWEAAGTPGGAPSVDALVTCSLSGTCGPVTLLHTAGTDYLHLTASATGGGPVVARSAAGLFVSKDGLAPFQRVLAAPPGQELRTASVGATPTGSRIVVTLLDRATLSHPGVLFSDNLGATFTDATGNLDATGPLMGPGVLPSGDMLAGLSADKHGHFALRQSSGTGAWAPPRAN
jgi:hypothetical protein